VVFFVVYSRSRRIVDHRSSADYDIDGLVKDVRYANVDPAQRRRCPHRDAKLADPAPARRRQFDPPSRLLKLVRSS
jgi:hypothetical protein